MDLTPSPAAQAALERMQAFMTECVYPAESVYAEQRRALIASGEEHTVPSVMFDLQSEAQARHLWNLFLPTATWSVLDYAPIAELSGRSVEIAPEAMNCSAPDTGNMEILHMFGTPQQKEQWLEPLMRADIRSGFAMTEPDAASSDATNIQMRIERRGDEYLINGRKWWTTGANDPRCAVLIVMGKTDPDADRHRQQSMVIVPLDTPGVVIERALPVFGYQDQHGHAEISFTDVRVPVTNLLGEEGSGFAIAQARLGPGRIHHCMRAIGMAERALELMVTRAMSRTAFGTELARQGVIQHWIAESRIAIDQARLLTLKAAWMIDNLDVKQARAEIAAIKVIAPRVALETIDRAILVFGGAGVSDDVPLAQMYAFARTLRIADGPDEVHLRDIARMEMKKFL
jgi:acyl-CoA dehydrogenase